MKKTIAIISLIMVLILCSFSLAFAAGLEVTSVSPKDGQKGLQPGNMAVKFTFSDNVTASSVAEANSKLFAIKDAAGNKPEFEVVYSEAEHPNELWLILAKTLDSDTEYTVTVKSGIQSKGGAVLSGDYTTTFKTRNTKTDSTISMLMMFVMMAIMFIATSRAAKKQTQQDAKKDDAAGLNPYKLAKEKNISLEEAKALVAKEKEKQTRIAEKQAIKEAERRERIEAAKIEEMAAYEKELDEMAAQQTSDNFRVKRPHSIKEAGGIVPQSVKMKNKAKRDAAKKAAKSKKK